MQKSYRSLGPNHVHQLMVAPSKHYYVVQDGLLKYQQKPFEIKLADMPQAKRQHMVIYTLRDHSTTMLYAEVCFAPALMPLRVFLARAWGKKHSTLFRGLPEMLITSRATIDMFAADLDAAAALGVNISPATSGFQSGIHGALAAEKWVSAGIDKPPEEGLKWLRYFCERDEKDKVPRTKQSKIDSWTDYVGQVRELPPGWGIAARGGQ